MYNTHPPYPPPLKRAVYLPKTATSVLHCVIKAERLCALTSIAITTVLRYGAACDGW